MEIHLKICMILPFPRYHTDMRIPPQIGICSYLTNFGHDVDWIIWSDFDNGFNTIVFNNMNIYITPNRKRISSNSIYSKIFNRLTNIIDRSRAILKIFNENNYNLILVRDDVFDGLVATYIKHKFNVPFVFMLSNPIEQEREYSKILRSKPAMLNRCVTYLSAIIGNRLLYHADLIVPISKWLEEHLASQGIPQSKIMAVPEAIDTRSFRLQKSSDIRKRYDLDNSKWIIYVGALGEGRCLELLIKAFSEVRKRRSNVKLLIVGEGDDLENLKTISCSHGIGSDVIFTGPVPHSEIASLISVSDIGVSPIPPFSFYKMSSPIKMFEYMAMAKPVIANDEIPEHKDVLERSGGGILVKHTASSFADAVIELLDNPERANEIGLNGQEWVMKNRTYEIMARKLEDRLLNLVK